MATEIERKFHVVDDRWRKHASKISELRQAYVVSTKNRMVRVRIVNACRATLAVKIRTGRLRREEYEYEIPYADAVEMFEHALGIIEKTRYEVDHQGRRWEIDVYSGANDGLVVAEIELRKGDGDPPKPVWLGSEITGNRLYSNRVLAIGARRREGRGPQTNPYGAIQEVKRATT